MWIYLRHMEQEQGRAGEDRVSKNDAASGK
jgi:hypothetical protein